MKKHVKISHPGVKQLFDMLMLCLLTFKSLDAFDNDAEKFSSFFNRVIRLLIDSKLSLTLSRFVLMFITKCFSSFENNMVRTQCLKLVTIGIWSHLAHQAKRESLFQEYPNLLKLWNSSNKKMVAASKL
jgi:intron-binding protein aquarius